MVTWPAFPFGNFDLHFVGTLTKKNSGELLFSFSAHLLIWTKRTMAISDLWRSCSNTRRSAWAKMCARTELQSWRLEFRHGDAQQKPNLNNGVLRQITQNKIRKKKWASSVQKHPVSERSSKSSRTTTWLRLETHEFWASKKLVVSNIHMFRNLKKKKKKTWGKKDLKLAN